MTLPELHLDGWSATKDHDVRDRTRAARLRGATRASEQQCGDARTRSRRAAQIVRGGVLQPRTPPRSLNGTPVGADA
jgi:hypothetical protein